VPGQESSADPQSIFLRRKQAAALLSVSPQIIDRLIRSGQLRGYRLRDRIILVKREEVLALLERNRI